MRCKHCGNEVIWGVHDWVQILDDGDRAYGCPARVVEGHEVERMPSDPAALNDWLEA